jgi:RNA polymerase sigma-70 factor (ECF subfamily)
MEKFREFYKKQKEKLFSYLVRNTGDYHLSMDIMQESFTRYLEKYTSETGNVPLLYMIARNAVSDHFRKVKRTKSLEQYKNDYHADQEYDLELKQEYRQVLMSMKNLDEDEREILALVLTEDLRYSEIASIVGIKEGNVKVKVHRARLKLRKMLQNGDLP